MHRYFYIFFVVFSTLFLVFSCKKTDDAKIVAKEKVKEIPLRSLNEKVLLILGEDYYKKPRLLECLEAEYNKNSLKENIIVLPYDSLMVKDFLRLKIIEEKIEEHKPSVIISLGLPERGGKYLLKASDEYKGMVIISAFAMEELAKLEAASDIVLDFTLPDELLNPENDFYVSDSELSLVLLSSFLSSELIRAHGKTSNVLPIEDAKVAFKKASTILKDELGQCEYTLKPYINTDVGMASYNYIMIHKNVIEDKDKK